MKILQRSGSHSKYPLAASTPVYAGGAVGAPALPLNAPHAPLSLGADHLLGMVMKVLQWVLPLLHCRVLGASVASL